MSSQKVSPHAGVGIRPGEINQEPRADRQDVHGGKAGLKWSWEVSLQVRVQII